MKLIFRADDYGYTRTYNDGTIKAITDGLVTSVDLMMDTPGAVDALERIRAFPWISVGWHTHFWGTPVAGAENVPSMVGSDGRFKFRKDMSLRRTVTYEDGLKECRAEVERCIRILGKAPDTTSLFANSELDRAKKTICDEYGIKYDFVTGRNPKTMEMVPCAPEYEHLKIYNYENYGKPGMTVDTYLLYNPLENIVQMDVHSDNIFQRSQHTGYLDDYILNESSCNIHRVKDVAVLCSEELKTWVRENHVELINQRDALFGTKEYQNHLRATGSDLFCKEVNKD